MIVAVREEVILKKISEHCGRTVGGSIGSIDGSNRGVIIKPFGDNVACRQCLEVDEVVGRHHSQGLPDTESKSALHALDDTAAQGPQAA